MEYPEVYMDEDLQEAEANGICYETFKSRLSYGWSVQKAKTKPVQKRNTVPEEVKKACKENGVSLDLYHTRRSRGFSVARAATQKPQNKWSRRDDDGK